MHALEERLVTRGEVVRVQAVDAIQLLGPGDPVLRDAPFPASDVRQPLRLHQSRLTLQDRLVLLIPLAHVPDDAHDRRLPLEHDVSGRDFYRDDITVGAYRKVLPKLGGSASHDLFDSLACSGAVIRMQILDG